jgi:hypothetical protein
MMEEYVFQCVYWGGGLSERWHQGSSLLQPRHVIGGMRHHCGSMAPPTYGA